MEIDKTEVKMKNYSKYSRGSKWRKWDLHIHSNASDGKMTCQEIVNKAMESNVEVIALTDHHTVKNIDEIKLIAKDKISIISGIEFRTEYGKKSVHIIGLFPEMHNGIELNSKNLSDLVLNPLGLSEAVIIKKGKELLNEEGKDTSKVDDAVAFKKGMFYVQVDFKKAADIIHRYGGLVIPHAGSKGNGIDTEMRHEGKEGVTLYNSLGPVKDELFKKHYIDICEIEKNVDNEKFYLSTFNVPSIITSDAHQLKDIGLKFTWIKADPTFDGLKQIVYEPFDRVKIQQLKPDVKNERLIISEIQFKSSDKLFGNQKILLNDNLNAIIGGKSSGKSLLLHSIAESIDPEQVQRINKRLKFDGYLFENENYDFEVTWKNEEKDILSDEENDNKIRKIAYIPQLYINYLAERNNKDELNKLVKNILLQDDAFKSYYEKNSNQIENITSNINSNLNELLLVRKNAFQLQKKIKEVGDSESIKKSIMIIEKQITEGQLSCSLTNTEVEEFNKLNKEKEEVEKKLRLNYTKRKVLDDVDYKLNALKKNLFNDINFKNSLPEYTNGEIDKIFDQFITIPDDILKIRGKVHADYQAIITNLRSEKLSLNLASDEGELNKSLKDLNKELIPYSEKIKGKLELKKLNDNLKKEKDNKINSELLEKQYSDLVKEYVGLKDVIYELLRDRIYIYKAIEDKINKSNNKIGEEISLVCNLFFEREKFPLYDQINKSALKQDHYFNLKVFNENNINYEEIPKIFSDLKNSVDETLIFNKSSKVQLRKDITLEAIFKGLTLDEYEFDFKVTYKNDELLHMSPGKKGTVLLILFLQMSSAGYPILIDQPEDNLDNRTIYDLLCKIVKEKKKERQIIIVSHNANLVVSTDSENIIVANQKGQDPNQDTKEYRFEYVNGALEHTFKRNESIKGILYQQGIREHVCDILEGGNEAFLNRERKYELKQRRD